MDTDTDPAEKHRELLRKILSAYTCSEPLDRDLIERAYVFAAAAHEGQLRASGQDFIIHPLEVAATVAMIGLDSDAIAAAILHDVVEDCGIEPPQIEAEFGAEVAHLVSGVTKLTRIHFESREQAQAANYRKMVVAMAEDMRVIVIKLADRLHNMRTIEYMEDEKQVQKAKETLEIYAPLASRLGIFNVKAELEDLSFKALHPRKYSELRAMVSERREVREDYVRRAAELLKARLDEMKINAEISGRAKHLYSIYDKLTRKGREFNEIYDLTAMRVIVEGEGEAGKTDCYAVLGIIHSLWKPMPGRFKDFIAMPKFNLYQSLHTTVIGPEGKPLEIQIRTREMHTVSEFGIAAHFVYKGREDKATQQEQLAWLTQLAEWKQDEGEEPESFLQRFRADLFHDEVYVFTPRGELKTLPAGSTPIDFAYAVHTDVGHRAAGSRVNGRMVPLHYKLQSGDIVEIITSKQQDRGPSRDWLGLAVSPRARHKIRQWISRETKEEAEQRGREALEHALRQQNLPYKKLTGSPVLAQVIRDMGFKKAEDFYLAIAGNRLPTSTVTSKIVHALKTASVEAEAPKPEELRERPKKVAPCTEVGVSVPGVEGVLVRLAHCCTPVPGDVIVGYVSLSQGITVHREDCPNMKSLRRNPERLTTVTWDGEAQRSFRVQIAVQTWDRARLLEDMARTFSDHGASIVEYGGRVDDGLARNWYTAEISDLTALPKLLNALRGIEDVVDAYRVTPS